jgi:K+-transporting ATPase ATPase B chain
MIRTTAAASPQRALSAEEMKVVRRASRCHGLFTPHLLKAALKEAFVMLRPDIQWKNPVMFVVEVGAVLTLLFTVAVLLGYQSEATVGYLIALDT